MARIRSRILILLLAFAGLFSGCSTLLYYPTGILYADPHKMGLRTEQVTFPSDDGTKLVGWWFHTAERKTSKATIVFFHGNGANISNHFPTLAWVLDHGYDFFIFDYRGYGGSEGDPNPEGTVRDGMAAIRYVHARAPAQRLTVFAQSLGGAVALRALAELDHEVPIEWITVDSTFSSYQQVGASALSTVWFAWPFQPLALLLLSDEWAPLYHLGRLAPTPVLVMHGTADSIVPYALGRDVYAALPGPKEFIEIPGGEHIDSFWAHDGKYRAMYLERLEARFGQKKP